MRIYLAASITGMYSDDVIKYFEDTRDRLKGMGYEVLHSMTGKDYLRTETKLKAGGYSFPPSTNHAIIERDRWMVTTADIVYCNLTMAKQVSIGCCMELAWAHQLGKHTVLAMQEGNANQHAFVLETADVHFQGWYEAEEYLEKLVGGKV